MSRTTQVISLSIPPKLAIEFDKLAKSHHKNKSQLFREMMALYKKELWSEQFKELQNYGVQKAAQQNIFTEEDIEQFLSQAE